MQDNAFGVFVFYGIPEAFDNVGGVSILVFGNGADDINNGGMLAAGRVNFRLKFGIDGKAE